MAKYMVNDLDRAIMALRKSKAAMPDFYREILKGDLWFLVAWHPEIEGERLAITEGSPLPFIVAHEKEGERVMLFSSIDRAEEAMKNRRARPKTFLPASMPATKVLEILGKTGLHAVVNLNCSTGWLIIPPSMISDLAAGKILTPTNTRGMDREKISIKRLDAADYPTDLVQAAFDVMRKHRNFRAAWIYGPGENAVVPEGKKAYYLMILMDPRDDAIYHELSMAVHVTSRHDLVLNMGLAFEDNPAYVAALFRHAQPFFVAPDYKPPAAYEGPDATPG